MDTSSNTGARKVQLVATQDGLVIVAANDWSTFLGQHFKKIPNIKKFHHIRFSKNEQGIVNCREYLSSPVQAIFFLRNGITIPPVSGLLQKINPEGLREECWNYLYREQRQLWRPGMTWLHQFYKQWTLSTVWYLCRGDVSKFNPTL